MPTNNTNTGVNEAPERELTEHERLIQAQLAAIDEMIQENLNAETSHETTARFSSAEWFEAVQQSTILIAGVGGIGSWLSLLISRMKPRNILLMDNDTVETVNMSGQLFRTSDVGKLKVDALSDTLKEYSAYYNVMSIGSHFTEESEAYNIMICGFDNMAARKLYFRKWFDRVKSLPREERSKCLFIDGRLNAEKFQVISIIGTDYYGMKKYVQDFLFEDSEVAEALCSFKQTTYCAAMIGAFMCNTLVNFLCDSIARPVLFFQEYDAETMSLRQES